MAPATQGLTGGASPSGPAPALIDGAAGATRERDGGQVKPWKSKKFFGDVVYDLRNRNLLLVVLMLLVAIVAVPLLISKSSSGNAPSPLDLGAQTSAGTSPETENAVVAYHPGVRNFK